MTDEKLSNEDKLDEVDVEPAKGADDLSDEPVEVAYDDGHDVSAVEGDPERPEGGVVPDEPEDDLTDLPDVGED